MMARLLFFGTMEQLTSKPQSLILQLHMLHNWLNMPIGKVV